MKQRIDNRPSLAEWPVKIWSLEEIPTKWIEIVTAWMQGTFEEYQFVHAPKRKTNSDSYEYLFGYGKEKILYIKETGEIFRLEKSQIYNALVRKELLNVVLILSYNQGQQEKLLEFPYIASTYYLYDPFLNWILGKEREFVPAIAEQENPRPVSLYQESLAMFNYSLGAYRLGNAFKEYKYDMKLHRHRIFPWKKTVEEWLEVQMENGIFKLHSIKYLTEFTYQLKV